MSQQVHARFHVSTHTRFPGWQSEASMINRFALHGVQGEPFGSATPSASMEMVIVNPDAVAMFIQAFETKSDLDVFFSVVPTPVPDPVPVVETPQEPQEDPAVSGPGTDETDTIMPVPAPSPVVETSPTETTSVSGEQVTE